MRFLSDTLWDEIRSVAIDAGPRCVAVPYLPSGAYKRLPLTARDVLVVRFDDGTIGAGQTDPREVLRYLDAGVEVHNNSLLHAKVYVSAKKAVICSANLSHISESRLAEAGVVLRNSRLLGQARRFVLNMRGDVIEPEFARRKVRIYRPPKVALRGRSAAPNRKGRNRIGQTPIWALAVEMCDFDDEDLVAEKAATNEARERVEDKEHFRIETVRYSPVFRLKHGDRVITITKEGRGRWVEAPARVLSVKRYASRRRAKRMMIALEIRKRLRRRKLSEVRNKIGPSAEMLKRIRGRKVIKNSELIYRIGQLWPGI